MDEPPVAITDADVEAAASRLAGRVVHTPLMSSPVLDTRVGARVFIKPECLQRTGSFKFRGATNAIGRLPEGSRQRGVVACSSGNHAQGVAEAARVAGIPATIVMPHDAPAIKRARTIRSGATVVGYDRENDDRVKIATDIAAETGATFVSPYDDPGVMAGQGTVGIEVAEDLARLGVSPDRVLVPVSGGGLLSGIATAIKARMPTAVCQPVEPEGFDDTSRSLRSGHRETNTIRGGSIADALLSQQPGELTFPVLTRLAEPGVAVPDELIYKAMAFAFHELKLVTEPGGAIALAALLGGLIDVKGETVVVVLSGGNVDPPMLMRALEDE
ncbi:pyridoxal-5'-phosphate-dependent protein [Acuticoccus sediminis]|uniref:Pyridoxal-5'-phosphate-dependent protein n=1 Tax=Acuticoccus sediminis TaxID=2184697 RepID=A0A8B2NRJ8_9HYPH|nr:threonine/serine dehydratase [Acuticoccus sediminis]RAH99723.1 pyridoxal-5'-phosphate-dependent protein [Acuticoccus sediminis]